MLAMGIMLAVQAELSCQGTYRIHSMVADSTTVCSKSKTL